MVNHYMQIKISKPVFIIYGNKLKYCLKIERNKTTKCYASSSINYSERFKTMSNVILCFELRVFYLYVFKHIFYPHHFYII